MGVSKWRFQLTGECCSKQPCVDPEDDCTDGDPMYPDNIDVVVSAGLTNKDCDACETIEDTYTITYYPASYWYEYQENGICIAGGMNVAMIIAVWVSCDDGQCYMNAYINLVEAGPSGIIYRYRKAFSGKFNYATDTIVLDWWETYDPYIKDYCWDHPTTITIQPTPP